MLYRQSLAILERLGDQSGMAPTISQLGILTAQQGHAETAIGLHGRALLIRAQLAPQDAVIDLRYLHDHASSMGKEPLHRALEGALGPHDAAAVTELLREFSQQRAAE